MLQNTAFYGKNFKGVRYGQHDPHSSTSTRSRIMHWFVCFGYANETRIYAAEDVFIEDENTCKNCEYQPQSADHDVRLRFQQFEQWHAERVGLISVKKMKETVAAFRRTITHRNSTFATPLAPAPTPSEDKIEDNDLDSEAVDPFGVASVVKCQRKRRNRDFNGHTERSEKKFSLSDVRAFLLRNVSRKQANSENEKDAHYEPIRPSTYIKYRLLPLISFYRKRLPNNVNQRYMYQLLIIAGTVVTGATPTNNRISMQHCGLTYSFSYCCRNSRLRGNHQLGSDRHRVWSLHQRAR